MLNRFPFVLASRREKPFRHGIFKYIILRYLEDRPCHGYEIIRAMEERFHGSYVPSAGTIYPRLRMLEEKGFVTFTEQDDKKVYSITDEGRRFLAEHSELEHEVEVRLNDWRNAGNTDDVKKTMREFGRLAETLSLETRNVNPEKLRRVRAVLSRTHDDIEQILEEES